MNKKTIKFYFQVSGTTDDRPATVTVSDGVTSVTSSLELTRNWIASSSRTNARTVDLLLAVDDSSRIITISPTAGNILLCGIQRNHSTPLGDEFIDSDIIEQPLINGIVDLTRYDITGHKPKGGDLSLGNLPIMSGEVATIEILIGDYY